jgi:integrase
MTWIPSGRRWRKVYKGKVYVVSCKQLGVPESKEASWKAANDWFQEQRKVADVPSDDERLARAVRLSNISREFAKLDDEGRREAVRAILGDDAFDALKAKAVEVIEDAEPTPTDRTLGFHAESWKGLLLSSQKSGQMSEGRLDAYRRKIQQFVDWVGPASSIDAIDEGKVEGYYGRLTELVGEKRYSPVTAHEMLMTAKQFIRWMAEKKLIPLPGNIDSRRFRFNHSVAQKIETFEVDEVRAILSACDGFSERTKLYVLTMLNTGAYQMDLAELRQDEVDWGRGVVTRARSKTRERGGPVVSYKLWPETFALLEKHRAKGGELALTTDEGNPLVKYWIEGDKVRRYDAIQSAWSRLAKRMGVSRIRLGVKHLRKTSASILAQHPQFKFYILHFLADSPKGMADKHYVVPSDAEFFEALDWLRGRILGAEAG